MRGTMGHTRRLADRVDLAAVAPCDDLASTHYCLARPGVAYLVYLPEGGEVEVNLSAAKGTLQVEWVHPVEGTAKPAAPVRAGEPRRFRAPFNGDAVLYLWRK